MASSSLSNHTHKIPGNAMSIENDPPTTYQPSFGQMGPVAPQPAPEQPKRKRKPKWFLPAGLAVAGLVLGFGAGVGNKPEPVTIETIVEKEVEVEVIKEVTPQSCIEALDIAAEAIGVMGKYPEYARDGFLAIANGNASDLTGITGKINDANDEIDVLTPKMKAVVGPCRASAE